MKIAILSRNVNLYSTKRLVEASEALGHKVDVIDTLECYMDITSKKPMVHYKNRQLSDYSAIIPRIGASITFYGTAVIRQFEMMGVTVLNESVPVARARDKLRSLQLLSRKGIGLPITGFSHNTSMTQNLIKLVGGAPLVIKLLEGTQGKGVVLAETNKAAESVIDAFRELDANILVQEFIGEANGSDIRCFVIGDKVVASMMRKAKAGEFRSNLHRGGSAHKVEVTKAEKEVAVLACKALGLNVAGVDLMRSSRGPLIIEVNSSPGLEGIETVTGIDVASMIIKYLEKKEKNSKVRRDNG
jgi:ribosomal protein S6--L-glutamate ligase